MAQPASASHLAARTQRLGNLVESGLDALQFQLSILVPLHPPLGSFVEPCPPASQGLSSLVGQQECADTTDAKDCEWNKPFAHWPLLGHPRRSMHLPAVRLYQFILHDLNPSLYAKIRYRP